MTESVQTINPATEEKLENYNLLSSQQAEGAVDNAHQSFLSWRKTSFEERAQLLHNLADLIEARSDELSALMTKEMGKVTEQGVQEVQLCAQICRYTADQAKEVLKDEQRDYENGKAIISFQPIGVILGIQPWNFPLYQVIRYSATTIMAGNTTVLKHASNVFGMAKAVQQLYEDAGFPEYVYQSLLIGGSAASGLIKHKHVRGVTFTGSDKVGKSVAEEAGKYAKKSVLELGSNDAYIVLADADIEVAVKACVQGRIVNNGETCVAAKRFIVVDEIYDQFREAFLQECQRPKVGDPLEKNTDVGPLARKDLREKIHDQVQSSVKAGAICSLGGEIPDGIGFYYPVTVLEEVKPGMPAYDDELFGPVASLIRVQDEKEAVTTANDSRYGLGGGIFSQDTDKAVQLAIEEFDTGMVNINGYTLAQPNLPFGGVKESGYGREHGGFGLREFVNIKTVMITN